MFARNIYRCITRRKIYEIPRLRIMVSSNLRGNPGNKLGSSHNVFTKVDLDKARLDENIMKTFELGQKMKYSTVNQKQPNTVEIDINSNENKENETSEDKNSEKNTYKVVKIEDSEPKKKKFSFNQFNIREQLKKYGKVGLVVYFCTSFSIFLMIFMSLAFFDEELIRLNLQKFKIYILKMIGLAKNNSEHPELTLTFNDPESKERISKNSVFVAKIFIALAVAKFFIPLKIAITLFLTPAVIRYGRRRNYYWALPTGETIVKIPQEPRTTWK